MGCIKDKVIKFETCLAQFMQYYASKKGQEHFEKYNMELTEEFYFKNYYDGLVQKTKDHYAEYRRQRDFLESKHGFTYVDSILTSAFDDWRKTSQKEEYDAYTWDYQRDRLNCAGCTHNNSADDKNFCDIFTKGSMPGLFLEKCPGFKEIVEPMD